MRIQTPFKNINNVYAALIHIYVGFKIVEKSDFGGPYIGLPRYRLLFILFFIGAIMYDALECMIELLFSAKAGNKSSPLEQREDDACY